MTVGRNDPCPCGSGRKFKKCHGVLAISAAAANPAVARANALKALDIDLGERLMRFARSHFGPGWLPRAAEQYLGIRGGEIPDAEMPLAIPWIEHSLTATADGLTLADAWRRQRANRVSPDERLLLDAYSASWLSIWEVAGVERGVGTQLVDLLTREERFVYDVASSQTLQRLDALLAFVLDCGEVSFFGGVHGQPLPPRETDAAVREARRICRVRTRPVTVDRLRDTTVQLDLMSAWNDEVDVMRAKPAPIMTNTDGDPIVMTTDEFELLAPRDEVARRLESLEGAEEPEQEDGDVVFAVTRPGNAQHAEWDNTVIARIAVAPHRLQIETNSTRRADAVRAAVDTHLEGMARFRRRTTANIEDLVAKARASSGPRAGPAAPQAPELIAAARAFREQHMTAWLDDSIPALNGLTPREAARSPRGRPGLELLLKEFEQREERLPVEERIDIGRLRVVLGLGAPT